MLDARNLPRGLLAGCLLGLALVAPACRGPAAPAVAPEPPLAVQGPSGQIEVFARLGGYMPTGIAIGREGRLFLSFPRWDDAMVYTAGELKPNGIVKAYPDLAANQPDPARPEQTLYSVQSVVVDARNRLWLLDTGMILGRPAPPGAAKLVAVDLATDAVVKTIVMPPDQVGADAYLNDMCVDLSQGTEGYAYITDSGRGGIIVVDIAAGKVMHRLRSDPSCQAADVLLMVEGRPLYMQPSPEAAPAPARVASDGVAISPDGRTLYYCPLASRRLYSVPTAALRDAVLTEQELASHVQDLGDRPAADGMTMDDQGRLYLTAFEHNAIVRRLPDGLFETLAQDPRLLWPDSLVIGPDGWLYVTANQLSRQARFNRGQDLRLRPFAVFRTKIGAGPVLLSPSR